MYSILAFTFVTLAMVGNIVMVYRDFRKMSMPHWMPLGTGAVNILALLVPNVIWNFSWITMLYFAGLILFVLLSYYTFKKNQEKRIGQADLEIIISLVIMTALIMFSIWYSAPDGAEVYASNYMLFVLQLMVSALLLGTIAAIVFWSLRVIKYKFSNHVTFKDAVKSNPHVPYIVAFIPLTLFNIQFVYGI